MAASGTHETLPGQVILEGLDLDLHRLFADTAIQHLVFSRVQLKEASCITDQLTSIHQMSPHMSAQVVVICSASPDKSSATANWTITWQQYRSSSDSSSDRDNSYSNSNSNSNNSSNNINNNINNHRNHINNHHHNHIHNNRCGHIISHNHGCNRNRKYKHHHHHNPHRR